MEPHEYYVPSGSINGCLLDLVQQVNGYLVVPLLDGAPGHERDHDGLVHRKKNEYGYQEEHYDAPQD